MREISYRAVFLGVTVPFVERDLQGYGYCPSCKTVYRVVPRLEPVGSMEKKTE